jgi:hypothetical protein
MSDQILFDRLIYIDKLKDAGIPAEQARAHADALDAALRDSVATRVDIGDLKTELRTDIPALRHDVHLGFRDATIRTGGMFIVAVGILLGSLKFFTH